jgi:hypothetical protein
MPQLPLTIDVKDPKSAMAAVMQMTLKHTADVLTAAVCAIAEKYGIDEEDMMEVVRSHPRFTEMTVEPMIHDLMPPAAPAVPAEVIVVEDVEPVAAAAAPAPVKKRGGPKKLSEMTPEERAAHDAKVAARKAKLAAEAAAAPAAPAAPLAVVEPAPVPEPVHEPVAEPAPVRKVFKIKPKAAQPAA